MPLAYLPLSKWRGGLGGEVFSTIKTLTTMFKQHLAGAIGVDVYLMISLFIFLAFFVGVVIRLFFYDKKEIDEISQLPLSDTIDENKVKPVRLY